MRRWLPLLFFFAALAARLPVLLSHLDTWYPFEVHCGSIAMAFHDHLDPSVGQITDETCHPMPRRGVPGGVAEADALHVAGEVVRAAVHGCPRPRGAAPTAIFRMNARYARSISGSGMPR